MTSEQATRAALGALTEAGVPHMVTGGLVANAYGIARFTKDADIVLQVEEGTFTAFIRALPAELVLDPQVTFETMTGSKRHILTLKGSPFQIELFFLGSDAFQQERFGRRVRRYLPDPDVEAWVATPEDMIVQKVRWNRDKDRDDARNIIAVQEGHLDWPYIQLWCDTHGTRERLEALRQSIPPI